MIPFDLSDTDRSTTERWLTVTIGYIRQSASFLGADSLSVIASPGKKSSTFHFLGGKYSITLSASYPVLTIILFTNTPSTPQTTFTYVRRAHLKSGKVREMTITAVSLPRGTTAAEWALFNLPRIEEAAGRDGARVIELQFQGGKPLQYISLPGMAEPEGVPARGAVLHARWLVRKSRAAPEDDATSAEKTNTPLGR